MTKEACEDCDADEAAGRRGRGRGAARCLRKAETAASLRRQGAHETARQQSRGQSSSRSNAAINTGDFAASSLPHRSQRLATSRRRLYCPYYSYTQQWTNKNTLRQASTPAR